MKILAAALFFVLPLSAQANLQVFPTRVLLTDSKRVAQLSLRQLSDKPVRYKISFVYYKMSPDGSMAPLPDASAGERTAAKLVRFSPREVTLPPNTEQVVRLVSLPSGKLESGDYRVHIQFEPQPEETTADAGGEKVTMKLEARVSVAVPITVRRGDALASAKMKDFLLKKEPDGRSVLSLKLQKEGAGFLFGDFLVKGKDADGQDLTLASMNGVASYIPERLTQIPLDPEALQKWRGGPVQVEYRRSTEEGGEILATGAPVLKPL